MLCFEYLEVVINAAIKVISNTRQDVFKKIVNSVFKIFCTFEKSIISGVLIHDFPYSLYGVQVRTIRR